MASSGPGHGCASGVPSGTALAELTAVCGATRVWQSGQSRIWPWLLRGWRGRGAGQRGQEQPWCRVLGARGQHEADACHSCPTDSAERVVQRFEAPGVSNYTALLLSPDGGTLYLGAQELLLSLNTSNFQPSSPVRRVSPGMGWAALGEGGGTQAAGVQGIPSLPACWVSEPSRIQEQLPQSRMLEVGEDVVVMKKSKEGMHGPARARGAPSDCPFSTAAVECR